MSHLAVRPNTCIHMNSDRSAYDELSCGCKLVLKLNNLTPIPVIENLERELLEDFFFSDPICVTINYRSFLEVRYDESLGRLWKTCVVCKSCENVWEEHVRMFQEPTRQFHYLKGEYRHFASDRAFYENNGVPRDFHPLSNVETRFLRLDYPNVYREPRQLDWLCDMCGDECIDVEDAYDCELCSHDIEDRVYEYTDRLHF